MSSEGRCASQVVGASPPFAARPVSIAVRDYVDQRKVEHAGSPLGFLVGVSGGADSLALVVAAADVAERFQIPLTARVVDHRMRDGSTEEANGVVASLLSMGIDAEVLTATDMPAHELQGGPEGAARTVRQELLEDAAQKWGTANGLASVDILLGHTMDDQAETVLLRLARGASPEALAAMRRLRPLSSAAPKDGAVRLYRGRPLLSRRRVDTQAFCAALGLDPVEDPTNRADGPWRTKAGGALPRSAVRERVLPELQAALEQDPAPALARVAELLQADHQALEQYAAQALGEALGAGQNKNDVTLDVSLLSTHPRSVRTRALRMAVAEVGLPVPSAPQIDELERALWHQKNASGDPRTVVLSGGGQAVRDGNLLRLRNVPR